MSPGPKSPSRPPDEDPADAWARVQREASAAIKGVNADHEELGDTSWTMATSQFAVDDDAPSNEMLDLVNMSLAAHPDRADLWMMRFEVQKTLGLKDEFAEALIEGWNHPRAGRDIDWVQVREMWEVLAPGQPAPDGIKLPTAADEPEPTTGRDAPLAAGAAKPKRRFADWATQMAGRQLGILGKVYATVRDKPDFFERYTGKIGSLIRRPTPLHFAETMTKTWGGAARLYFKREDLRKVTPEAEYALAQAWLGLQLGRKKLITGNDVDGHSLGLAIAAQRFEQQLTVTVRRPELQEKAEFIARLKKLGVNVVPNTNPKEDEKDPRTHAVKLWMESKGAAHLALSLGWGPGPYPSMVNDFQSLIGREVQAQVRANSGADHPLTLVASVGSEVDAIGFVLPYLNMEDVELVFAEPEPGGPKSWRLSKRLKHYNGARREHSWLSATGRITHIAISDAQALAMQQQVGAMENIKLTHEDARAVALASLLWRRGGNAHNYVVLAG